MRRRSGRGSYDRETVHAILDEGFVGHVGLVDGNQPFVIPMLYARVGEALYLHGSPLSRILSSIVERVPLCFTVTLIDGLVLARSAFHHSVNYRSVVVLGAGSAITDQGEKEAALTAIVEHIAPGRSADARGPDPQELAATEVIELPLEEVSAKVRSGPPIDAAEDYMLDVWAGELPLGLSAGVPAPDDRCSAAIPDYVRDWRRGGAQLADGAGTR